MPEYTISSVKDLISCIESAKSEPIYNHTKYSHKRIWFRGHSDNRWKLVPGVYRENFTNGNEEERLTKERHLTQDFKVLSGSLLTGKETNAQLYFLQQHYGMPTRLLDWTNNPLISLWFAVSSINNKDKDGEIFMMDAYSNKDNEGSTKFGIATEQNPKLKKALSIIFDWKKKDQEKFKNLNFIIPIRPAYIDTRISLQKSLFTFHSPTLNKDEIALTTDHNPSLLSFAIPKDAKERISSELSVLGIDEFTVYGDLASLANKLKTDYS